ncbi:hypothetical protein CH260_00750 [Rhodococcus sp. 05-2256-B2]|nr:hypothetical protein CH257_24520 [Rhodococcus sp. 05-2256-B3]OZD90799.1 hypothetical protein CH258_05025 [Rhodococcus sp. 05-2256-B4]OZE01793.1 hypothetical protein CH260_00750 [Rhodococcus sp. 05-2256-B2]OZE07781.1 hypothetical protein CH285_03265 [Rhodococcus sp. 05-2256-B1]
MRRHAVAVGLAVVLAATANPAASAQQLADPLAAEQNCVVAPTTTTSPVPTTTTAVPTPACTTTDTTASIPPVQIATTDAPVPPATTTTTTTMDVSSAPTETSSVVPTFEIPTTGPAVSPTTNTTTPTLPTVPIETTTGSAPSPVPAARAAAAPSAASLLNIETTSDLTPKAGQDALTPGVPWTGNMGLSVVNVLGNWTSTVSLSPFRGQNTGRTVTPVASYSAPETNCLLLLVKSPGVSNVPLSATAVNAKTGGGVACLTSWTATVNILVPNSDLLADTYTATLTHSIY